MSNVRRIMRDFRIICPHCHESFTLHTYNMGMSEVAFELRCTQCPAVLAVSVFSYSTYAPWYIRLAIDTPLVWFFSLLRPFGFEVNIPWESVYERVSNKWSPCNCGGTFRHDAPLLCPLCLKAMTMAEIKQQINWWGTANGNPGAYTTSRREI
jgi:uncharacterized CHY-type Zn-finger protein